MKHYLFFFVTLLGNVSFCASDDSLCELKCKSTSTLNALLRDAVNANNKVLIKNLLDAKADPFSLCAFLNSPSECLIGVHGHATAEIILEYIMKQCQT